MTEVLLRKARRGFCENCRVRGVAETSRGVAHPDPPPPLKNLKKPDGYPQVGRTWLRVCYNKIRIYPMLYELKGDYTRQKHQTRSGGTDSDSEDSDMDSDMAQASLGQDPSQGLRFRVFGV